MSNNWFTNLYDTLLSKIFSRQNADNSLSNRTPKKIISDEVARLQQINNEYLEGLHSEKECIEEIESSFRQLRNEISEEQFNAKRTWIRYVNVAVRTTDEPLRELIDYINSDNYRTLSEGLTLLSNSLRQHNEKLGLRNLEVFSRVFYTHILEYISPQDTASFISLGQLARKKGDYAEARKWFEQALNSNTPFHALTSILTCYEDEIKQLLRENKQNAVLNHEARKRIRELNKIQFDLYMKWSKILKNKIDSDDTVSLQDKEAYVQLMTRFSRFERDRGFYTSAFDILNQIPESFPYQHRIYCELAMLHQSRNYRNPYYNLEKSIECFQEAEKSLMASSDNDNVKISQKSILIPLANSYYSLKRYDDALDICEQVLQIDAKEKRALRLHDKISAVLRTETSELNSSKEEPNSPHRP